MNPGAQMSFGCLAAQQLPRTYMITWSIGRLVGCLMNDLLVDDSPHASVAHPPPPSPHGFTHRVGCVQSDADCSPSTTPDRSPSTTPDCSPATHWDSLAREDGRPLTHGPVGVRACMPRGVHYHARTTCLGNLCRLWCPCGMPFAAFASAPRQRGSQL